MNPVVLDLSDPDYWINPYPTLVAARSHGRTTTNTAGEIVLLHANDTDKVHIDQHFVMPGLGSLERVGIYDGPFYEWRRFALAVMDGKNHQRLRSFAINSFAPRQMERLRAMARERAHTLIDAHAEAGEMNALADFATDLPLWSMCRFIGIDEDDRKLIESFLIGTEEAFANTLTPERRAVIEEAIVVLDDYVGKLIERRRQEPREDVVSLLVTEQGKPNGPTNQELQSLIMNIIGGAVGSTRAAFSNSIAEFARHPDQADLLRNDPSLAPRAVEECLRYNSPFRLTRRVVKKPIHVFGMDLAPGQIIYVPRQAYNRDPERFENPDVFDILRPEKRHIGFGYGAHFCLGQAVARTNLQEGLKVFLDRCHDLELVQEPRRIPFSVDEQLDAVRVRFRHVPRQDAPAREPLAAE